MKKRVAILCTLLSVCLVSLGIVIFFYFKKDTTSSIDEKYGRFGKYIHSLYAGDDYGIMASFYISDGVQVVEKTRKQGNLIYDAQLAQVTSSSEVLLDSEKYIDTLTGEVYLINEESRVTFTNTDFKNIGIFGSYLSLWMADDAEFGLAGVEKESFNGKKCEKEIYTYKISNGFEDYSCEYYAYYDGDELIGFVDNDIVMTISKNDSVKQNLKVTEEMLNFDEMLEEELNELTDNIYIAVQKILPVHIVKDEIDVFNKLKEATDVYLEYFYSTHYPAKNYDEYIVENGSMYYKLESEEFTELNDFYIFASKYFSDELAHSLTERRGGLMKEYDGHLYQFEGGVGGPAMAYYVAIVYDNREQFTIYYDVYEDRNYAGTFSFHCNLNDAGNWVFDDKLYDNDIKWATKDMPAYKIADCKKSENVFAGIDELVYTTGLSWATELKVEDSGEFVADYYNWSIDSGDNYSETVYTGETKGRFKVKKKISDTAYELEVKNFVSADVVSNVKDGVRYSVIGDARGFDKNAKYYLYMPGTPVSELPSEVLYAVRRNWNVYDDMLLPDYAIYAEGIYEAGFAREKVYDYKPEPKDYKYTIIHNEGSTEVELFSDMFNSSPRIYHKNLALFSMSLCAAAYNESDYTRGNRIYDALKTLGFKDSYIDLYSYPGHKANQKNVDGVITTDDDLAFSIATKDMDDYKLMVITLRGSHSFMDWFTDFKVITVPCMGRETHIGFAEYMVDVLNGYEYYLDKHPDVKEAMNKNRVKVLITGHSLGGGAANLVGQYMYKHKLVNPTNLYVYTFASPNNFHSVFGKKDDSYDGIWNVMINEDPVTKIPTDPLLTIGKFEVWTKYGSEKYIPSPKDDMALLPTHHTCINYINAIINN